MSNVAYVVSTGVITAIGNDRESCKASLINSASGISKADILKTHWRDEFPVGEIKRTNEELALLTKANPAWPRTALLSAIAVQEALQPLGGRPFGSLRAGFFSANTVGGMDLTEGFYEGFMAGHIQNDLGDAIHHECGAITELVARHFNLPGYVTTVSTACSSSANSIMQAARMIRSGMVDMAIAGGADGLSRFTLNGFHTLMILDRQPCQPFDQNRRGLNLGEGAGYIVLMNETAMQHYGLTPLGIVSGYANANDAYHQTASSPEGTGSRMAMEEALLRAQLDASEIDYINLHGTGTANNDSSEGKAIASVFGAAVPPASSTKGFTGHILGGCGGVEAVFSLLSIAEGMIWPNLRLETPMEDISWQPISSLQTGKNIRHVMSNSFGFGGNCSSLIFSKS